MKLHELRPAPGAKETRKRRGQGIGSGNGKTAGKGHKGQKSRSGGGVRPGFEGGQMPLARRIPKRGFSNFRFAKNYQVVNLQDLESRFSAGAVVDFDALAEAGLVRKAGEPVKILGTGDLGKALTVKAAKFSASATAKIEAAGGKAEVI